MRSALAPDLLPIPGMNQGTIVAGGGGGSGDGDGNAGERWTANGRVPPQDERESISIGLLAARELENTGDPQIDDLHDKLESLHNYFEDWPTDDQAASATDDDFFDA